MKFGFDQSEHTDLFSNSTINIDREQITDLTKKELIDSISNEFDNAVKYIENLSKSTGKKIILALSGGVDSMVIYKLLSKHNIDFQSINIAYDKGFDESKIIKEHIGHKENIKYLKFKAENSLVNLDQINFSYLVSHPTLISYYNLISSLGGNSLLVTGDLADEIFGYNEPLEQEKSGVVFNQRELINILGSEFSSSDDLLCNSFPTNDIDLWYNNITYKMFSNCLVKKDIEYFPFFSKFYKFTNLIAELGINDTNKTYLKNYLLTQFGVDIKQKKEGFKYPVLDSVSNEYLHYIEKNVPKIDIKLNMNYIHEHILSQEKKSVRWKLFSLVVLVKLLRSNDNRLIKNKG